MNFEVIHVEQAGMVINNVTMSVGQPPQPDRTCQAEEVYDEPVKEESATAADEDEECNDGLGIRPLANVIFKETLTAKDGQPVRTLQLDRLHGWIERHFVSHLTARYEWFALWRMLYDLKLIEGSRAMTSKFVKQMNDWYPGLEHPCEAGAVNRFRSGYLGETPFWSWDEGTYHSRIKGKQSWNAIRQLSPLCEELKNTYRTDDFYV